MRQKHPEQPVCGCAGLRVNRPLDELKLMLEAAQKRKEDAERSQKDEVRQPTVD